MIKRDQVIAAYQLFLNRKPENELVIKEKMNAPSLQSMITDFMLSEEYFKTHNNNITTSLHMLSFEEAKTAISFFPATEFYGVDPSLREPTSQLCTASQFLEPEYKYWCEKIKESPKFHRKQWEFIYILNALNKFNMLTPGTYGLGFGCGKEPLPSVFAGYGIHILATDQPSDTIGASAWASSNEYTSCLEDLYHSSICERNKFKSFVQFDYVDMNDVPKKFENTFDFIWSACALEHLGSIQNGLNFIENTLRCLKPGGIAIHTTEFNLSSLTETYQSPELCFFRKSDIDNLYLKIKNHMYPVNYCMGNQILDNYIDLPPYTSREHLKLLLYSYITTSIGIIIKK